jgi:hypothetical protein
MEHCAHRIAAQRLFETAASQEWVDFDGLPFHGGLDRRVVKQRDPMWRSESRERVFELQRLVDGLLHEGLEHALSPGPQRPATKAARETLDARESDIMDLACFAVENLDANFHQQSSYFVLVARLEVVLPSTATIGIFTSWVSSRARARASSGCPLSVRSPHKSKTSATSVICLRTGWKAAWELLV